MTTGFPVFYKCRRKGCRHLQRVVFTERSDELRYNRFGSYHVPVYGFVVDHKFVKWDKARYHGLVSECSDHGSEWISATPVAGSFSDQRECDARCMNARGPQCECQCGGANHGASYGGMA